MPIVDVEIVLRPGEILRKELASALAGELGEIFQSPPGTTWIKVYGIDSEHYAENGGTPAGIVPIFVSIIRSRLPDTESLGAEVEKMTGAVAQICGRSSENVHLIYHPEARGRLAFGGKIVA